MEILLSGLFGAVLGGVVATYLNSYLFQKHHRLSMKRDVLARFAGNRHLLGTGDKEPFISLNQTFVVFEDSPAVISALKELHEGLGTSRADDRMLTLIKAMADASGININRLNLNDDFFLKPFQRGAR